jgi:hypothetical protein
MGKQVQVYLSNLIPDWRLDLHIDGFAKAKPSFFMAFVI